jgi:Kef-type K+ transport system membrane component KefB
MSLMFAAGTEGVLPDATTFFAIGLGAFLLPLVARRIGLPAVVLEILFGLVIGPHMLGLIGSATTSEGFILVLAELGLFLLMFLAGFEIDFDALEREGKGPIVFGLGFFVLIVVISWFGLGLVGLETTYQQIFLTLLISAASVGSSCLHCGQPVVRPRVRAS